MVLQTTLNLLDALYQNIDPNSGERLASDSIFQRAVVRNALANLSATLRQAAAEMADSEITHEMLEVLCQTVEELGYQTNATQLLHICRGSRRVVDPQLRSLTIFGRYRERYSRATLKGIINDFCRSAKASHVSVTSSSSPAKSKEKKTVKNAWEAEAFFTETPVDRLAANNALSLQKAVWALGLRKPTNKLPAYQIKARQRYPRAYEPWTKAEKALLLEAMCYTNQLAVLSPIFGRGEQSLKRAGQRLIWESRRRRESLINVKNIAADSADDHR